VNPGTPQIEWAHQGGAKEHPANTKEAMRAALERGGNVGLELDVHLAKQGRLVVIHDRTLHKTTNGQGRVRRHELARLRSLDAAHWWTEGKGACHDDGAEHPRRSDPPHPERRVLLLSEVLVLREALRPDAPMTIEVKHRSAVDKLVVMLQSTTFSHADRVTVTSFSDRTIWRVRRKVGDDERRFGLAPGAGYLLWLWVRVMLGIPPRRTKYTRVQIPVRLPARWGLTFASPRMITAAGKMRVKGTTEPVPVDVWTVDDPEHMQALFRLGVDGIMTDCPAVLRQQVEKYQPSA
jgi:glycerophosphoryl diester phosphodiesterase